MKILIIGHGVIGTAYGYILKKAGNTVKHLIRDDKNNFVSNSININLLDGRFNNKGEEKNDIYTFEIAEGNSKYDFILISVSSGKIEGVIGTLKDKNIKGTLVVLSGIYKDRDYVENIFKGYDYILGYPVAGGNIKNNIINCCVFDHIMLESKSKTNIKNYKKLLELLSSCSIKAEAPFDMLEWIWIHMAINAAVILTAVEHGDIKNPAQCANNLMDSSKILSESVLTIRETVKIAGCRNINLKNYNNELFAYKIPSKIAGIVMKRMFRKNNLTRSIMTLHNNIDDLIFVCESVYESGKNNNIQAPRFYEKYEIFEKKLKCISLC